MNDKEAMTLALEALELANGAETVDGIILYTEKEIKALKEALAAEQEQRSVSEQLGEPVAYLVTGPYEKQPFATIGAAASYCKGLNKGFGEDAYTVNSLYTTPQPAPQRSEDTTQKKPLTDEQIYEIHENSSSLMEFTRAIEAAHGIKENT